MNFCHRDDAAAAVMAVLARGTPGAIFHGSDSAPARRREVVIWIAQQLGISPQQANAPYLGPNRRILSDFSRERLGLALRFPSFQGGFGALLPARAGPGS
jgi:nucleoside-diphosphate-sugar epimerase